MSHRSERRRRRRDAARSVSVDPAPDVQVAELAPSSESLPADDVAQVRKYLAHHDTKSAVKQAKRIHGRAPTPDSESLLLDAYQARVEGMHARGLAVEANSLVRMLESTFASAKERFQSTRLRLAAISGDVGKLAAVLGDPQACPRRRSMAEDAIRRELTDLPALAACEALAADHPLRRAAQALMTALEAVTRGPVNDADLALPEVSRRSPLSAWKLLVRAIGCFHRHDDAACTRWLDAIDGESVPARLVPAVRQMLDGSDAGQLTGPSSDLVRAVSSSDDVLRRSLTDLDATFDRADAHAIARAIRRVVHDCTRTRPELLDRMRQHISIRSVLEGTPVGAVARAMGGPSRKDAYFWRLFARATEMQGKHVEPCGLWEQFRRHTVQEGWFSDRSPQTTALYLHMLGLLQSAGPDELACELRIYLEDFADYRHYYANQPDDVRAAAPDRHAKPDLYYTSPTRVFERICSYETDPDIYAAWLKYASGKSSQTRPAEEVAVRWHEACPRDGRPLLYLAEAAESRQAFTKALRLIEQAEECDALNPQVKRARLRMLAGKAIRHLRQHKPHLVEKDLAQMAGLPQAQEGDRPAFAAALGWLGAAQAGDEAEQQRRRHGVAELLEDPLAADVLLECLRETYAAAPLRGFSAPDTVRPDKLLDALGRCCRAADEFGALIRIPARWVASLKRELLKSGPSTDPLRLRAVGEAARRSGHDELLFAVSRTGLALGPDHQASFLYLRGESLLPFCDERRTECLTVAAELARRRRQTDLVSEIVDALHGRGGYGSFSFLEPDDFVADDMVDHVLQREKKSKKWPRSYTDLIDEGFDMGGLYAGRSTPASRRDEPPLPGFLDEEDIDVPAFDETDDEWDDGSDDEEGVPLFHDEMTPLEIEVLKMVAAETRGRTPTIEDLDRLARKNPKFVDAARQAIFGDDDGFDLSPGLGFGPTRMSSDSRKERRRQRKKARRGRRH